MQSRQYLWRMPGGTMQITEVDGAYFVDNDRPLQEDAIALVEMTPELASALRIIFDFAEAHYQCPDYFGVLYPREFAQVRAMLAGLGGDR